MSKLDDILKFAEPQSWQSDQEKAKQEIKTLMIETYNKALQAYFIDKTAKNLDDAFDKAVEAL